MELKWEDLQRNRTERLYNKKAVIINKKDYRRKMAEVFYTDPNFVIAGIALIGVIIAILELNRSIKISLSNAETTFVREFNEQNEKCRAQPDFKNLIGMLNLLELVVKHVKRGMYPFDLYKNTFFHVTFEYIFTSEMAYYDTFHKTTADFKNDFERYVGCLLPVFDLYEEKINKFLKGANRTTANLKPFLNSKEREPSENDFRRLKYKIKYPHLYSIGEALGFFSSH